MQDNVHVDIMSPPLSPVNGPTAMESSQNTGHAPSLHQLKEPAAPQALAPGFQSLMAACLHLYPGQTNPVQMSTMVKFWLGGPDPLDYITMFAHAETAETPDHWHYVSCGLSDLHGDGRVHPPALGPEYPSGYGFELTFRLTREQGQMSPPVWPAKMLQKIAKYIFKTENKLVPGDHIMWSDPLGGPESVLKHLLVAEDPELAALSTALGRVQFLLIAGVTDEELKAAQRWNGPGVINLLKACSQTGGSLLVTDVSRRLSLFELNPESRGLVEAGIMSEGSNLCGMAACIAWAETDSLVPSLDAKLMCGDSGLGNWDGLAEQCDKLIQTGSPRVTFPHGVALSCNLETASYLPLCVQGRLRHGFHFTLKSVLKGSAVTFLVARVAGSLVTPEKPYAAQGDWLQILIPDSFLEEFYNSIAQVGSITTLPHRFTWPQQRLSLTVVEELL